MAGNVVSRRLYTKALLATAARWKFADFQSPTYSAVMMEFVTPPSYGSTVVNVGGVACDGEIIVAGVSNTATYTEVKGDPENDWPEPGAAKFVWAGKTSDGNPVEAILKGALGDRLDRVDVMAEVPGFVKTIVGGIAGTRPYIYQVSLSLESQASPGLMGDIVLYSYDSEALGWQRTDGRTRNLVLRSHLRIMRRQGVTVMNQCIGSKTPSAPYHCIA